MRILRFDKVYRFYDKLFVIICDIKEALIVKQILILIVSDCLNVAVDKTVIGISRKTLMSIFFVGVFGAIIVFCGHTSNEHETIADCVSDGIHNTLVIVADARI